MQLHPSLQTSLEGGDVGNGELLPGLDLVLRLERQGLVGEDGMSTVWNTGVRHEAERGEYRLAT